MKNLIKIFFLFCVVNGFAQQNLVPNHSFEIIDTCPNIIMGSSPSHYSKHWFDVKNTPDFFSACDQSMYTPPHTSFGYQCPANGSNFMGIHCFVPAFGLKAAQEIFGCKLIDSTVKNTKYYVSLKVNIANDPNLISYYGIGKIGVKFFTKKPSYISNTSTISDIDIYTNNFAQVFSISQITDTLNWVTINGSFIADSNYQYIAIGNFFKYQNSDTIRINPGISPYLAGVYCFIDDVCVSTDSITCNIPIQNQCIVITSLGDNIKQEKNIVSPNPIINDYFQILNLTTGNIKLADINCKILLDKQYFENDKIDVTNLGNGVYYLFINDGNQTFKRKLIINH